MNYRLEHDGEAVKKLRNRVRKLSKHKILVGWTKSGTAYYPDKEINTATVAMIHELGLGSQTRKGFLAGGIEKFAAADAALLEQVAQGIQSGGISVDKGLDLLGAAASQRVQDKIKEIGLIDTALLRQTTSWEVE